MAHQPTIPTLARRLLCSFLRDDLLEEVQGDLEEKYLKELHHRKRWRAKLNYWYQVLHYVRPFAIRKSTALPLTQYDMFQNYLKIAWRSLAKQRMYSFIKIGGFAIGLTACFLISLYIKNELSYDQFLPDAERTYRLIGVFNDDGNVQRDVWFPAPFAQAINDDYPDIEAVGRLNPVALFGAGSNELRRADKTDNLHEEGFAFADQGFLDVIQIPFIYGNRGTALTTPLSMVMTREKAEKYFPNENPIGKQMILNDEEDKIYTVTGVMDLPGTSHIPYQFLVTLEGVVFYPGEQTNWGASNYPTYVRLKPGVEPHAFSQKMTKGVLEKYWLPRLVEQGVPNPQELLSKAWLEFQPVRDIHLNSFAIKDGLSHGDIRFVWLFGSIAGFILLIACINFINLSTAKSANRAKEVGLRKTVGSLKRHLVNQFLIESILLSFIAFVIGIMLAALLLPYFNTLADKALVFPWTSWWLWPLVISASVVVGILAGLYPSLYLSSFKPIQVLKGNVSKGVKRSPLRNALVVFQFATSIALIVCTFVINKQMQFILNTKVGYDKDHVLLLQGANTLGGQVRTLKEELKTLAHVQQASVSDYIPISGYTRNGNSMQREGAPKDEFVNAQFWRVDADYISTLGMRIIAGRDFNPTIASDSQMLVVNESMVRELSLEGDGVGSRITNFVGTWTVVGVVEDFHFESMKDPIYPVAMALGNSPSVVSVRIDGTDVAGTIQSITQVWQKFSPNQSVRFSFLDESYERMYSDVKRTGWIFSSFAVFAILVACLGLFALSAFMTEQRRKEISIRMVLGASVNHILHKLTGSFLLLIAISFVLAVPAAWYLMNRWLQDYAYKVAITWDLFALSGALTLVIAVLTISYQSVKAALMNPVTNLRSE